MNKGDIVYDIKTKKAHRIKDFVTVQVNEKDVFKVVTSKGEEFFYDEIYLKRRKSDGIFGWLFG